MIRASRNLAIERHVHRTHGIAIVALSCLLALVFVPAAQAAAKRPPRAEADVTTPTTNRANSDTNAADSDAAVQSGRDVLKRSHNFPWYDPDTDSLRPAGFARNKNQAKSQPSSPPPSNSSPSSVTDTGFASSIMQGLMWIVVALVLCGLVYMLIQAYLNRENMSAADSSQLPAGDGRTEADRVESLPFAVRRTKAGLLEEARRNYEAGNYREAIIYFYSHILVELDRAQYIRLERGKTNREYLREVTARRPLRDVLESTMLRFEDVFFGDHPLPREQFEVCWRQLPQFEQMLQTASR